MQPEQQQRIMGYFIEEAKDHLNTIEQGLLNLQSTIDDPEMVNEVFRAAHSVKGGAAMLGLGSIQQTSHRLEDYFKILKETPGIKPDQKLESLLLRVFDTLQELLEQLQGPFGLVEETANATVTNVEPVFAELQLHLDQLAGQSAGAISFDEDTVGFAAPRASNQAVRDVFQDEVPGRLREMLQLFKQAETMADGREQLQANCQSLAQLGKQFNLRPWSELVAIAQQAIANPDNSYRALAPVIIKDLKQAQSLVLEGQVDRIEASQQLCDLLPLTAAAGIAADDEFADFFAVTDDPLPVGELSGLDLDFAELPGVTAAATEQELNLDVALFDETALAENNLAEIDDIFADRNGPEVGMAELNSLADLFEGEMPELGATWQEEEVLDNPPSNGLADFQSSSGFSDSTDFSDLFDDTASSGDPPQAAADDLESLFSDDLLGEDVAHELDALPDLAAINADRDLTDAELADFFSPASDDAVADLSNLAELNVDEFANLDLAGSTDLPDSAPVDRAAKGTEDSEDLDNLGELFAGLEDTDLELTAPFSDWGAPQPGEGVTSLGELDFDGLMLDNTSSSESGLFGDLPDDATPDAANSEPLAELGVELGNVADPWNEGPQIGTTNLNSLGFTAELTPETSAADLSDLFSAGDEADNALLGDLLTEDTIEVGEALNLDSLNSSDDFMAGLGDTTENLGDISNVDNLFEDDSPQAAIADQGGNSTFDNLFGDDSTEDLLAGMSTESPSGNSTFDNLFGSDSTENLFAEANIEKVDQETESVNLEDLGLDEAAEDDLGAFFGADDNLDLNLDALALNTADLSLENAEIFDFGDNVNPVAVPPSDFDAGPEISALDNLLESDFNPEAELASLNSLSPEMLGDDLSELSLSLDDPFELSLDSDAAEPSLSLDDGMFGVSAAGDAPNFELTAEPDLSLDEEMFGLDLTGDNTTDLSVLDAPDISLEDDMFGLPSIGDDAAVAVLEVDDLNLDAAIAAEPQLPLAEPADLAGLGDIWDNEVTADLGGDLDWSTNDLSLENDLGLGNDFDLGSLDAEAPDLLTFATSDTASDLDDLSGSVPGNTDELSFLGAENSDLSTAGSSDLDDLFGSDPENGDDLLADLTDQSPLFDSEIADATPDSAEASFGDLFGESVPAESNQADNNLGGLLGIGLAGAAGLAAGAFALGRSSDRQVDAESIAAVGADFDQLEDEFADLLGNETTAPAVTDSGEFGELDDLLGDAPSGDSLTDPNLDDLTDLDALLGEPASDAGAEFAGLDDLLGANDTTVSATVSDSEDFLDLEALLADAPEAASTAAAITGNSDSAEFDDLEKMLEEADMTMGGSPTVKNRGAAPAGRRPTRPGKVFSEQTMRVPVKHLDNLSNLVGELVVNRNSLEQDQERLRQSLDNLLYQVQQLSDVGQRMQDLYERSLLESSLLASRQNHRDANNAWLAARSNNLPATPVVPEDPDAVEYDPLEMDRFTGFHSLSQEMIELIVRVRESASDIEFIVDETDQVTRMFRQVTTQLQEGLTRSRMVPFAQTADRLPRAVRDIAVKCGKQAELVIEGRETLIDKMILEHLYDPMTHLVNNALTHGIETPDIRQGSGKSATGRITIRAFHQGNQTVISVSDDGAGIDIERVRSKGIEKGLISPAEARTMTKLDLYDLLFHPGFSTKDQADDFAGRGVGMDVVRTSLSEIRGAITTDSSQGKGTTFTIRLPLTLSISKALCCISDRARVAFPMDGVEDMLDIPKERVQTNAEGQPCLAWRDAMLPLRPLTELLGYNRHLSRGNVYGGNQEDDMVSVVILRSAGTYLALEVDQVLGEQEIVIKQLEGPIPKPVGVAGATVLGDGRIMPIADVLELIDLSVGRIRRDVGTMWDQGGVQPPELPAKTEPTVLIVDDSITVRELLSMTFNKVGYRVEQARDGQEAWEKLRAGLPCDIVFCDIEMPRMDGLELLSRIQKDPNLNHLPIAMLTSRGADRHRQMASSLGASGYFTKPYLEEALLDAAQRMLKGEVLMSGPRE
jgi:chemotaxis protein histidine kinase CheA/CheY-like chemotaxis protein